MCFVCEAMLCCAVLAFIDLRKVKASDSLPRVKPNIIWLYSGALVCCTHIGFIENTKTQMETKTNDGNKVSLSRAHKHKKSERGEEQGAKRAPSLGELRTHRRCEQPH